MTNDMTHNSRHRRIKFHRSHTYGLTTLELEGPLLDVEVRVLSKLDKRARRTVVRSFIGQIRPWLEYFQNVSIDHSGEGFCQETRAKQREINLANSRPLNSLSGSFGFEVRLQRLKLGLNQAELAKKLGIQRTHLSAIERGVCFPHEKTRVAIQRALQTPLMSGKTIHLADHD